MRAPWFRAALTALTSALVVVGGTGPLRAQVSYEYEVVDLGTFGGELANAFSINDAGEVVGRAEDAGLASKGFLWRDGELIELEGLSTAGTGTTPYAINDNGEIAGSSLAPDPELNGRSPMPFYWSETLSQPPSFTRDGTIDNASPAGIGATRLEFTALCPRVPVSQGVDGFVFVLPDVPLGGATVELSALSTTGSPDLRVVTWDGGCALGDELADEGAEATHVLAHGTRYVLASTDSGSATSVTLKVTPAPSKVLNLGQDLTSTGTGAARDLNNDGVAVGVWRNAPFTWSRTGGYAQLPFLPNPRWNQAEAMTINDSGVIAGWATDSVGYKKPVRWDASRRISELPVLGGGNYGTVNDVNSAGVMVGEAGKGTAFGPRSRPVIWAANGRIEEIPLAPLDPPLDTGFAEGINDLGAIVGWDASNAQGDGRQVPWIRTPAGVKSDLNTMIDPASGWELMVPMDVNDHGQIVGIGVLTKDGVTYEGRAFLLNPLP